MSASIRWKRNGWLRSTKGNTSIRTAISVSFWKNAHLLVKIHTLIFWLQRVVMQGERGKLGLVVGL